MLLIRETHSKCKIIQRSFWWSKSEKENLKSSINLRKRDKEYSKKTLAQDPQDRELLGKSDR